MTSDEIDQMKREEGYEIAFAKEAAEDAEELVREELTRV